MQKSLNDDSYALVDSGHGRKLEKFGRYLIDRPCAQAVWNPAHPKSLWNGADAIFTREGENKWIKKAGFPEHWSVNISNIHFKISATDFGHLGVFPEQAPFWLWIQDIVGKAKKERKSTINVLNLFAYSGGSTLAAARGGAHVCHLDASKGMVAWARENAALSGLEKASIRWIIDDVNKFLARELRRGTRYDGIILDPPSFGRGSRGEVFKIENDLQEIMRNCKALLTENPLFLLFSCHTPGFSPLVMHHILSQTMQGVQGGCIDSGEMILSGDQAALAVPSGVYARWYCEG